MAWANQKGVIISEEGTVFKGPDFDAEVLTTLPQGKVFDISDSKKGAFFKIRVKPGSVGWISDADVKPVSAATAKKLESKAQAKNENFDEKKKPSKSKPIEKRRFRGLVLEMPSFRENTIGAVRTESLLFYGARFSGTNTLMDGDMNIDSEIIFHSGAPKYYVDATGNSAGGFILIGNLMFITEMPQSKDLMAYFGFGPTFKMSHFEVTLNNDPGPGSQHSYSLDDFTLGAVFGLGVAYAFDHYAVRLEARYYWETQRYPSFGLAIQKDF